MNIEVGKCMGFRQQEIRIQCQTKYSRSTEANNHLLIRPNKKMELVDESNLIIFSMSCLLVLILKTNS